MIRYQSSVVIRRPNEAVFTFAADYRNDRQWRSEVREVRYVTDDPVGVGMHAIETVEIFGRRLITESKITAYVLNGLVAFDHISGPLLVRGSRTFEAVEGGTRFSIELESQPTGRLDRLLAPIAGPIYQRKVDNSLLRLKAILEGSGRRTVRTA